MQKFLTVIFVNIVVIGFFSFFLAYLVTLGKILLLIVTTLLKIVPAPLKFVQFFLNSCITQFSVSILLAVEQIALLAIESAVYIQPALQLLMDSITSRVCIFVQHNFTYMLCDSYSVVYSSLACLSLLVEHSDNICIIRVKHKVIFL